MIVSYLIHSPSESDHLPQYSTLTNSNPNPSLPPEHTLFLLFFSILRSPDREGRFRFREPDRGESA